MGEKSLEHQVLVALMIHKIEEYLRETIRDLGDIFKSMGLNTKDVGLLSLDLIEEAVTAIKVKAQVSERR